MTRKVLMWNVVVCVALFFAGTGWADVPAPPVNQAIAFEDVVFSDRTTCGSQGSDNGSAVGCHSGGPGSGNVDLHHNRYNSPTSTAVFNPIPDSDGDSTVDAVYGCLTCHGDTFFVERNCQVCHSSAGPALVNPHHNSTDAGIIGEAQLGNCSSCHTAVTDLDPSYVASQDARYAPNLVTPSPGSTGTGATGECSYCHDADAPIAYNSDLHHGTGLNVMDKCIWCHDLGEPIPDPIRVCGKCHSYQSLHAIQADSDSDGDTDVGQETAGYGHVGRDAGIGDSDCWGCHGGYTPAGLASITGPVYPTIHSTNRSTLRAGVEAVVVLTGSSFTNTTDGVLFESDGVLTGDDGASVTLARGPISDQGTLSVIIPADTAPGNYKIRAVKHHLPAEGSDGPGKAIQSNPIAIQIIPEVVVANATSSDGVMTIQGSGFAGYAEGAGTVVTGRIGGVAVEAVIVSWSDTEIKADFGGESPGVVTVRSVFGICDFRIGG